MSWTTRTRTARPRRVLSPCAGGVVAVYDADLTLLDFVAVAEPEPLVTAMVDARLDQQEVAPGRWAGTACLDDDGLRFAGDAVALAPRPAGVDLAQGFRDLGPFLVEVLRRCGRIEEAVVLRACATPGGGPPSDVVRVVPPTSDARAGWEVRPHVWPRGRTSWEGRADPDDRAAALVPVAPDAVHRVGVMLLDALLDARVAPWHLVVLREPGVP